MYSLDRDETQLYSFGCLVGSGHLTSPITLCFSTGFMLKRLANKATLHVDVTFKLSDIGLKMIVLGQTDSNHSIHPVAVCLVSDQTAPTFRHFFAAVVEQCNTTWAIEVNMDYVMCDAEMAMRNALRETMPEVVQLMCSVHAHDNLLKSHPATTTRPEVHPTLAQKRIISGEFWKLVHSLDKADGIARFIEATANIPGLTEYFVGQWVESAVSLWHVRDSAPGVVHSNNAMESFNAVFKRCYSLRRPLPSLITEIKAAFSHYRTSVGQVPLPSSRAGKAAKKHEQKFSHT